ncbi:MAG: ATP-dependent zinc metalloprotease FtsH [Candidatus Palauibacterales bacterium]|nr:ATP-dependent zinc metalloprotease FtsH [Candidatus Palauibacterales bacterium]MDP2483588.1 ATP-dependent zinc metalloprotease FtsH [Candidatus Palauibacterales bacterium]
MAKTNQNDGNKDQKAGRFLRTASFWALVILIPLAIFQVMETSRQLQKELTYTEFREQLDGDNIKSATFTEGRKIEGELRTPMQVDGQPIDQFHTLLPTEASQDLIDQLETAGVEVKAEETGANWVSYLISVLPWILIIGLWFFFFRQMQAGGSRAFSFGKSKAKLLTGDTPHVTFADVAGADEAKEDLKEIIEFLKDPAKFRRLGGRLPKGALLVGPPGTGKTLLARAVAGEAGRPFFSMSGSDFVEMFVGVGASRVRDLFEQGKTHAPCIIFIDEIDAVGRHRGAGLGGGHDEREQTLNQLLVEMDGFESNEGVILLAATNRPDVLDPALLRPGRFDRQIVVDSPDVRGREGILRVHTKEIPLSEDVELKVLAKGTPGLSGADLANIVNEAALLAARKDKDRVYMEDFEVAKDKVMLGAERRSLVISEEERRVTAYHEAGHAVIARRVPGLDPLHKVTIVPRGRALGVTASLPEEDRHNYTKGWLEGQLVMLFGGRVAEEMVFGPAKITTGAGNDIERATMIARRMVTQFGMSDALGPIAVGEQEHEIFLGREFSQRREVSDKTAELVDAEIKRILDDAYSNAERVLNESRDLLGAIAEALLERETLDLDDVRILEEGGKLPPLKSPHPIAEPATPPAAPVRRPDESPLEDAGGEPSPALA